MLKWLSVFLGFQFLFVISNLALIFKTFVQQIPQLFFTVNLLQIFFMTGTIGLLISPFFFPSILYGLPRYPEPLLKADQNERAEDDTMPEKKVCPLNLEENYIQFIRQKTESAMMNDHDYLITALNLQKFSERILGTVALLGHKIECCSIFEIWNKAWFHMFFTIYISLHIC
jgi:hypothetical protein